MESCRKSLNSLLLATTTTHQNEKGGRKVSLVRNSYARGVEMFAMFGEWTPPKKSERLPRPPQTYRQEQILEEFMYLFLLPPTI